jgi:hypothetical protein
MKRFNELTKEEKVELTEEQLLHYAKLECADKGIIIPQKPMQEVQETPLPTTKFYSVGYSSFVFRTEQEAQDYADAISKALSTGTINDSRSFIRGVYETSLDIKSQIVYTDEEYKLLKETLESNKEIQREWEVYNKQVNNFNSILSNMQNEIYDINHFNTRVTVFDKIYSDYLELAQGNEQVAHTFFSKAYKDADLGDIDREVVDNILNTPIVLCAE